MGVDILFETLAAWCEREINTIYSFIHIHSPPLATESITLL